MIYYKCRSENTYAAIYQKNFKKLVKKKLRLFPEKCFFMVFARNYLGHDSASNTGESFKSKKAAIHKSPSATRKIELRMFLGSMKSYSDFISKLHDSMETL